MPDNNESLLATVLGAILVLFLFAVVVLMLYYLAQNAHWEFR